MYEIVPIEREKYFRSLSDEANEDDLMSMYGLKTNPYHTARR